MMVALAPGQAAFAGPVYADATGVDLGTFACDAPSGTDMCDYDAGGDSWQCHANRFLSSDESVAGSYVVNSKVTMIKDSDHSAEWICFDETSGVPVHYAYCAFGVATVYDVTTDTNVTRRFFCGQDNGPLSDVRLVGTEAPDHLTFHHNQVVSGTACTAGAGGDECEYDLRHDLVTMEALMLGAGGTDELHGSRDPDTANGYHETLDGGADADIIWGHPDGDEIRGGGGDDTIYAGAGDDTVWGGLGADTINGGEGADEIHGGAGNDGIAGGGGDDTKLFGEADDDVICGDAGDDVMLGGPGDDLMASMADPLSPEDTAKGGLGMDECDALDYVQCDPTTVGSRPPECPVDPEI